MNDTCTWKVILHVYSDMLERFLVLKRLHQQLKVRLLLNLQVLIMQQQKVVCIKSERLK